MATKLTATTRGARLFATAYGASVKSSHDMLAACVVMLSGKAKTADLAPLIHTEVNASRSKANMPVLTADEAKKLKALVSQRAWGASTLLIVGEDAATDPVAIRAILAVSSGAFPRTKSEAVAAKFKGSNDGAGFAVALKEAAAAHKPTPKGPKNLGGKGSKQPAEQSGPALPPRPTVSDVVSAVEALLTDFQTHAVNAKTGAPLDTGVCNSYGAAIEALMSAIDPHAASHSKAVIIAANSALPKAKTAKREKVAA